MLVSHRKKFIFTKTVKTAGTSVEVYFEKYCFPEDFNWQVEHAREQYVGESGIVGFRGVNPGDAKYSNHMTAIDLKTKLGDEVWNDYFKFSIIRNPYDRLISAFYHFEVDRNKEKYQDSDTDYVSLFRDWLKVGKRHIDRSAYMMQGRICLDFLIRYEQLIEDLEVVCKRLEIPFVEDDLPKLKTNTRKNNIPIGDYYDEQSIAVVERDYEFELRNFGYELPVITNAA